MIYKPMHLIFRATINPSNWEQEHATTLADRRSGSDRLVADSCDHGSPNLAAHVSVGAGTCCHVWDEHEVPMGVMPNHSAGGGAKAGPRTHNSRYGKLPALDVSRRLPERRLGTALATLRIRASSRRLQRRAWPKRSYGSQRIVHADQGVIDSKLMDRPGPLSTVIGHGGVVD
jgi:hypothetical protein